MFGGHCHGPVQFSRTSLIRENKRMFMHFLCSHQRRLSEIPEITWMIWLTLSHPQKAGLPCIGTCADKPVVQKSLWVHNHPFAELHLLTQPCWACQAVGWGQMFLCVCRHGAGLSLSSRDNPKLRVFHQKGNLLTVYFVWWKNTQHSWLDCIY